MTTMAMTTKLAYSHGSDKATLSSFGYIGASYIPIIGYDQDAMTAWVIDKHNYPTFLGLTMDSQQKSAWLGLLDNANKGKLDGSAFLTLFISGGLTYVRP